MEFDVEIDLTSAEESANAVRSMLIELRDEYDFGRYEYCKTVKISPFVIPFSHPVITLSTFARDPLGLVAMYLHEQMHWYATWYSHTHEKSWQSIFAELKKRYPVVPSVGSDEHRGTDSTYLHLLINWLEIECTSQYFDRTLVSEMARELPFYQWNYGKVLDDWIDLQQLFESHGVLPVRLANEMTCEDLVLAAKMSETTLFPNS